MTPEQVQACKNMYSRIAPYRIGNPDDGRMWFHYEDYIDSNDREWVLFWESLIYKLREYKFPYTLPKAVKYVVLSEYPPRFESVFKIIHWLEKHTELI